MTSPPDITIRVGAPVVMKSKTPGPDTKRIMSAISALLPEEGRVQRTPTEEELRRSYPSSYKGDPSNESKRRPGSD